jgi:uncharacterized repeat protein (TIGR01451 family)
MIPWADLVADARVGSQSETGPEDCQRHFGKGGSMASTHLTRRLPQGPGRHNRPGRTTLARLLLALGLMLGVVGALFPSTASAIDDPNIPDDGWNDTWDPDVDWSTHPAGWPHPASNPALTQRCGIDIGIVIDRSGSIADANKETVYRDAAKALVDALAGTPSKIGVWSFANKASDTDATTYPWLQMADMNVPANVTALKNKIDSIPIVSNFSTNYEEGIRAPFQASVLADPRPDLLVVITDGQPTVHEDDSSSGGTTNNDDIAGGIASANLVKATGTRIFGAGVGGATAEGLELISGTNEYTIGEDIASTDYVITAWENLDDALRNFATSLCGANVTVTKQASTMGAPGTYAPAADWHFTGTLADGPAVTATPADGDTDAEGEVSFHWSSPETESITITETQKPGFELADLDCKNKAGQTVGQEDGLSVTIPVAQGDQISCVYKNRPVFIDLSVTKDDGQTTVTPGQVLDYTINYGNAADATATANGVVLTETVPANTTYVAAGSSGWSCANGSPAGTVCTLNVGDLAPGAGGTAHFKVQIANPVGADVSQIVNTVTVTDNDSDVERDTDDQTDTDTDTLQGAPNLTVVKTDGDGGPVEPGDVITYSITYANSGNKAATDVYLSETVPANTTYVAAGSSAWSCADGAVAGTVCTLNIGTLAGGGADGAATFKVRVVDPVPAGVTNVANTVLVDDSICVTKCDDDPEDTPLTAAPDMKIVKTDSVASVAPGEDLTYNLRYDNIGNQGATGVVLTETVPADTTWVDDGVGGWDCSGTAAGSTCTYAVGGVAAGTGGDVTFTVRVDDPVGADVEQIDNVASVADDGKNGPDPTPENNTDDEDTPVDAAPDLEVLKDDAGATVSPGDELTYTIEYRNAGNQTATDVVLVETVPEHTTFVDDGVGGWECLTVLGVTTCVYDVGSLAVSDTWSSVSFTVLVDDPLTEQVDSLLNNVAIDDDECEGVCDEDDEDTPVDASPVLTVEKDDDGVTTQPGGVIVYSIDYANNGDEPATGVVLTETVPANTTFVAASSAAGWDCNGAEAGAGDGAAAGATCTLEVGELAAGATGSTTYAVRVASPLAAGVTEILNTVTIGDDEAPNPDDADTESTPVRQPEVLPNVIPRTPAQVAAQPLPRTGSDLNGLVLFAGVLTLLGGLLLVTETAIPSRRRRET